MLGITIQTKMVGMNQMIKSLTDHTHALMLEYEFNLSETDGLVMCRLFYLNQHTLIFDAPRWVFEPINFKFYFLVE